MSRESRYRLSQKIDAESIDSSTAFDNTGHNLSETSLPISLKNAIPTRNAGDYERGYTANIDMSVLDYTTQNLDLSQEIDAMAMLPEEEENQLDDDDDDSLCEDPLNKAICGSDDDGVVETRTHSYEMPSFMDDSARIPDIEHVYGPADGDDSLSGELQFGGSIDFGENNSMMRSVRDNSLCTSLLDESITEQSMLRLQQANTGRAPSLDMSVSVSNFDYSFNQSPVVERQRAYRPDQQ